MEDLEVFQCGYCRETFEITDDLIEHVEQNHSDNEQSSIESEEEESHFDVIFTSNEIPIQDSPIDTFECYPCQIKFKSEADLASHIQIKHGDDDVDEDEQEKSSTKGKWTCSKCEKSFKFQHRLKAHLETHIEIHSRARPFQCQDCDKRFLRSSDLWAHQRIHSGSKYTCLQCGKKLASSGSLHNHKKSVHEESKRFECHVCFKGFALKQKLVNHVMSEHEGQKPFQCDQCDQGFIHKQSFEAHKRRHQGNFLHCELCAKPFVDEGYLKKHMNWHKRVQKSKANSKQST